MRRALRCLAPALLALVLLPAVATADTDVERDATTGIITIVGDGAANNITVEQTTDLHTVKSNNAGLLTTGNCTLVSGARVDCDKGTSLSVDLGAGNDVFEIDKVAVPISVAGGGGNDTLSTGGGNDVLAGGAGNDTLNGRG